MAKATVFLSTLTQLFSHRIAYFRKITPTVNFTKNGRFKKLILLHENSFKRMNSNEASGQTKAYLYEMGFDTKRIEDRRPTTLKGNLKQIQNNINFLRKLNIEDRAIQSIISRQPGILSVSIDHLQDHVSILLKYNLTFEQIGQVICRAPKFFSVPVETIQGNIRYIESLQVTKRKIHIILLHYPTTFSRKINGIELVCTQIQDILKAHITMDEELTRKMLRSMVMTSPKVFIRSPGEIARNIKFLEGLGFTNKSLYTMVRFCPETLRVYPSYIQTKFDFVQQLFSLDHQETVNLITRYPRFINFQPKILQLKTDSFKALGFTLQQIKDQPRVFSFSLSTFDRRYKALKEAGYEFETMRLLTLSETQIDTEVQKLKKRVS